MTPGLRRPCGPDGFLVHAKLFGQRVESEFASADQLYQILAEKQPVTPITAVRLEAVIGGSARSWVNMQAAYDLWRAKRSFKLPKMKRRAAVKLPDRWPLPDSARVRDGRAQARWNLASPCPKIGLGVGFMKAPGFSSFEARSRHYSGIFGFPLLSSAGVVALGLPPLSTMPPVA
jgi:hypothetical protein